MFGPVSGGHFNPVVSFVDAAFGGVSWRTAGAYLPVQVDRVHRRCDGGQPDVLQGGGQRSRPTTGPRRPTSCPRSVATLGLILVIFALARSGRSQHAPAAVAAYIGAAYFFTSSTGFANPAITVGRMFSNTFAGIAPSSVPSFIAAQVVGGALAVVVIGCSTRTSLPPRRQTSSSPTGATTTSGIGETT